MDKKQQKKWSEMTPQEKKRAKISLFMCGAIILFLVTIFSLGESTNTEPEPKEPETKVAVVHNSEFDGSVRQVEKWLKANLNDPDSYESLEWSPVQQNPDNKQFIVRHKYRAANGFGAKMIYNQSFTLDSLGNVISVSDFVSF